MFDGSDFDKPCQHLGGINLVDRVMDALLQYGGGTFDGSVVLVDLLGYDGWTSSYALIPQAAGKMFLILKYDFSLFNKYPMPNYCFTYNMFSLTPCLIVLYCLTCFNLLTAFGICPSLDSLGGRKVACGTACHTAHESQYCATSVAQKAYSMARAGSLKIPGFPQFESVVQEMKLTKEIAAPQYEVTVALSNGTLAIKENLVEYWSKEEHLFSVEMARLLVEHNKKYNPHGVKRGASTSPSAQTEEGGPAKKPKIEASVKPVEHEAQMSDKCFGQNWYHPKIWMLHKTCKGTLCPLAIWLMFFLCFCFWDKERLSMLQSVLIGPLGFVPSNFDLWFRFGTIIIHRQLFIKTQLHTLGFTWLLLILASGLNI